MVFLNKVDVVEDEELLELVEMELRGIRSSLVLGYLSKFVHEGRSLTNYCFCRVAVVLQVSRR